MINLKTLPYGGVESIYDPMLEEEVNLLINESLEENCLNDLGIHNNFLVEYKKWILSTNNNTITGLEQFKTAAFSNGTTEAFDKFYLKHKTRRLRYFRGEYMYHRVIGKHYFNNAIYIDDAPISENDVVIISFPFADSGGEHPKYKDILDKCNAANVPVLIDCAYINVSAGLEFNFDYNCIKEITFSLSKAFPVSKLRIGMRLTREDDDDPLLVYNKNNYINRLGAALGLKLITLYSPDYNFNRYRPSQLHLCDLLGIDPSPSVIIGTSLNRYPEYNRGGAVNRLCLSRYLKTGKLPVK